jgi:hypothetical protein
MQRTARSGRRVADALVRALPLLGMSHAGRVCARPGIERDKSADHDASLERGVRDRRRARGTLTPRD